MATAAEVRMATAARTRAAVTAVRTAAVEGLTAATGRVRPATEPWAAASRGPDPVTGGPRWAIARPSLRSRRRRRTAPAPPARAAHTTGTSEPRSLPILWQPGRLPAAPGRAPLSSPVTEARPRPWRVSHPAISACSRPPKRRTNRRIDCPADCDDCLLGAACPLLKNCRQPQSAPSCKPARPGWHVTQIIGLVTVTCHRNSVAAHPPVQPSRSPAGARGGSRVRVRLGQHAPGASWGCQTGEGRPELAQPARSPARGRVASRRRLPRQRVRGTPSGGSCLASRREE